MCGFNNYTIGYTRSEKYPKRYTVVDRYSDIVGSYDTEKGAMGFIKDRYKSIPSGRYWILESIKEISAETPKLLIEELN